MKQNPREHTVDSLKITGLKFRVFFNLMLFAVVLKLKL